MAARLRPKHQDEIREKIRASQLVNRLTDHALGNLEKNKSMDPSQVTAALGLLKKCVPDLSRSEVTGKDGAPMEFKEVRRTIVKK